MHKIIFKENNLDFIRLLAASQVCILHTFEFMDANKTDNLFFDLLHLFPGVPIFFFISGFLISKSFESSPDMHQYAKNRILRIYPALIAVVLINILMVWSTGYFNTVDANVGEISLLFLAKASFLQFYNPDFMRGFGDGVLNGSLWTICVELQFYILTPLLYIFFGKKKQIGNLALILLIIFFMVVNGLLYKLAVNYSNEVWWKLFRVSFAPWFYMFLFGVLIQRNFQLLSKYIERANFPLLLVTYGLIAYVAQSFGLSLGNSPSPILFVLLAIVVLSAAYYRPYYFGNILQGNDISYGVYIWHMPIVNHFLYYDMRSDFSHAVFAIILSYLAALVSWVMIEKPSLKLKNYSIHWLSRNNDSIAKQEQQS